jgi:uncharacterized protein (DUF433 family)
MPAMSTKRFTFPETVPLTQLENGAIRVGGTRINLDTVIARFQVGDTPEEIQSGFPSLALEQINTTIDWYLNHKAEADEYLEEGRREAARLRHEAESDPEYLARRKELHRRAAELRRTGQLTRT